MREQLLAPQPVGQPAEEQRADHRADQIGAGGEADLLAGEVQHRAFGQRAGQRADDGDLQPVEHPGDAERDDHQPVKPAPRQAVEPRRHVGFEHRIGWHVGRSSSGMSLDPSPWHTAAHNAGETEHGRLRRRG